MKRIAVGALVLWFLLVLSAFPLLAFRIVPPLYGKIITMPFIIALVLWSCLAIIGIIALLGSALWGMLKYAITGSDGGTFERWGL
jgi:hypothetical protein